MKNEKKLLNAEIVKKKSKMKFKIKVLLEGFFTLFYFLTKEDPLDNLWWECISLIIQYIQLIIFIFDEAVSQTFLYRYSFRVFGAKIKSNLKT